MKIDKTFEDRVWGGVVGHWFTRFSRTKNPLKLTFRKRNQKLRIVNSCLG